MFKLYSGLGNINFSLYENDFTFRFGNKSFKCPTFLAEIISPKVSNARKSDPTIQEIFFDINIPRNTAILEDFSNLLQGKEVEICNEKTNQTNEELIRILYSIGNKDILMISSFDEITIENVYERISIKKEYSLDYSEEINFCARNFETFFHSNHFKKVSVDDISLILESPFLTLESEDSLCDFISQNISSEKSPFLSLMRYVKIEFLSANGIKILISIIDRIGPNKLLLQMWESIKYRLIYTKPNDSPERHISYKEKQFHFKGDYFKGIINHLLNTCKCSNNKEQNFVELKSSPMDDLSNPISCILEGNGDCVTKESDEGWIQFDFLKRKLLLSGYSLQSNSEEWAVQPRSWTIQGSNDGKEWVTIDSQNDVESMHGYLNISYFPITHKSRRRQKSFRYFRINRVGDSWGDFKCFSLRRIEFFGSIIE